MFTCRIQIFPAFCHWEAASPCRVDWQNFPSESPSCPLISSVLDPELTTPASTPFRLLKATKTHQESVLLPSTVPKRNAKEKTSTWDSAWSQTFSKAKNWSEMRFSPLAIYTDTLENRAWTLEAGASKESMMDLWQNRRVAARGTVYQDKRWQKPVHHKRPNCPKSYQKDTSRISQSCWCEKQTFPCP